MPFLNQSRFPTAWRIFQFVMGCVIDKRTFAIARYHGEKRVLEVGCSLGNVSQVFRQFPDIQFTGLDIDPIVIDYAQRHFCGDTRFRFVCCDLRDFARGEEVFDLVLFPGMLHHIDDDLSGELLQCGAKLVAPQGRLIVIDPIRPQTSDPWLHRTFMKLEQGQFLRSDSEMKSLVARIQGFRLSYEELRVLGATPFSQPKTCTFGLYELARA